MLSHEQLEPFNRAGYLRGSRALTDKRLIHDSRIDCEMVRLTVASELRIWHDRIQCRSPLVGGWAGWHHGAPAWPIIAPAIAMTEYFNNTGIARVTPNPQCTVLSGRFYR